MSRNELPWVIPEYCEGCTACVAACKRGCIAMFATAEEAVFIPWIEGQTRCTVGGIMMTSYVDEARERLYCYPATAGLRKLVEQ